ncbi:MAG: tetratricopeptide repeat protein [Rubrivivax sp.]|nr:tetratricopeptide repeat protein [Rubrivivax sp.]
MTAEPIAETTFRTFLFTDIEGSTRLWEQEPERMREAVARHDVLSREAVLGEGGRVVKSTGDGLHAVFAEPAQALRAALRLQVSLAGAAGARGPGGESAAPGAPGSGVLALKVRCGVHCGESEARDGDFYGPELNRAARVMSAAHGGQTLVTQAVAERAAGHLPAGATLQDLGSVRLRDLASPVRVYQLQHPALRAVFPPLRSLEATPNNLAQQLNSFVGREHELAEVRALLARTRLLTLLGMGGIGKSRLSVQLGAELLDEYPDGVWLVELAPLADPLLVPQALASVLGVKEERGASALEAVLAFVRDKALLVILDNCEHVVRACADLAKRLLQAAPGVRVLATSRDVLEVAGETIYQVPTLGVPAAGDDGMAGTLPRHAAVRLFVDRASAVQPRWRLDPANGPAVAAICRQLDGIPLALELAAARTRALSVQAIAERLSDRFRLLVSGDHTVLPRQRTLRALIDWSFELLSEPERALFRRLAVFAGGWTLEAAEAVCADGMLPAADVLDLLAQLVQKSLVVMEPGGARYRMLETVRAYAAEKLAEAGEEPATRRGHVAHYVGFADRARAQLAGPQQARWLGMLDAERENLLAVHAGCAREPALLAEGLRLVFLLKSYWHARGLLGLGHRITVEALARVPAADRTFERCRALCDAGQLAYHLGRYAEARGFLEESHAIAHELGEPERKERLSAVLPPLGFVLGAVGERRQAMAIQEAAMELAGELGRHRQRAVAINSLAQLHRADGQLDRAEALYVEALHALEALEDHESVAITRLNLAMVAVTSGRPEAAVPQLRRAEVAARTLGSLPVRKSLVEVGAGLCAVRGASDACARLFGAAEALAARTGIRRDPEDDGFLQPLVTTARHALGDDAFAAQVAVGRAAVDAEVDAWLGAALGVEGDEPR